MRIYVYHKISVLIYICPGVGGLPELWLLLYLPEKLHDEFQSDFVNIHTPTHNVQEKLVERL